VHKGTLGQWSPVDYDLIHPYKSIEGGGSGEMEKNRWVSRQCLLRREHV